MKISQELVEISKVYKDDEMNLTDKYQAIVDSIPYAKLYQNIVEVFPDLKDGNEDSDWNSGTVGWHNALVKTVGREKMDEMFKGLEWYDSDHLDGAIEARLDKWYRSRYGKLKDALKDLEKTLDDNQELQKLNILDASGNPIGIWNEILVKKEAE